MANNTTLGDRLKVAREDAGLSASELSRRAGMSRSYVAALETRDGMQPRYESLTSIATALGIRAEWLATGEGPMRREAS